MAEADLILHVRDVAHPDTEAQRADVIEVLDGMAHEGTLDEDYASRMVEVLNKADLVGGVQDVALRPGSVAVSALTGEGFATLLEALDARIAAGLETRHYDIPHGDGARLAWLYTHGEVTTRDEGEASTAVTVRLLPADRARFEQPSFKP